MKLKTLMAALTAATFALGMTACNRDNAGAGSSTSQQSKRSGTAAGSAACTLRRARTPERMHIAIVKARINRPRARVRRMGSPVQPATPA